MNILFILTESTLYERLGVMHLSTALKAAGHTTKIRYAESFTKKSVCADFFADYAPHIVAFSAMTNEFSRLATLNQELKKTYAYFSIFGGPHATFYPEIIKHDTAIDALCIGEADYAFPEFCRRMCEQNQYWRTPNFIVRKMGTLFHNPLHPLIKDLDALGFADRDAMYEADPALRDNGLKLFLSSRGCPYSCTYCFNHAFNALYKDNDTRVRHHSPEYCINEIVSVKNNYSLSLVYINDDTFLVKPNGWIKSFCTNYKEKVNLPFSCHVRADLVTEETIAILKDAGLDSVWIGIECGDETVANAILKRNLTNEQIIAAVRILQKHSIKIATQNLTGLPVPNSFETDLKTLDLNILLQPTFAWSSILYPYPGTEIETYARENGYLTHSSPTLESNKRASILSFNSHLEKRQIENLHKLFGIIVRFPWLRKWAIPLSRLPLSGFYTSVFYLWYGYSLKVRIYPFSSWRKEITHYIRLFGRILKRS